MLVERAGCCPSLWSPRSTYRASARTPLESEVFSPTHADDSPYLWCRYVTPENSQGFGPHTDHQVTVALTASDCGKRP